MNREIKFRGLTTNNNVMVFGDLIHTPDNDCRIIWYGSNYPFTYNEKVVPNTIGQYTGLKDKNGVEIYEGDIIETPTGIGQVCFDEQYLHYFALYQHDGSEALDIGFSPNTQLIGNIYQNPELVKP